MDHFATAITYADGKIFTTNTQNACGFDAESGKLLWQVPTGRSAGVQVYNGKTYIGDVSSVVKSLYENTGSELLEFQAPISTSYGYKCPPFFFVADGKVFASQNGIAVYDANNGASFWQQPWSGAPTNVTLGKAGMSASPSNYIYIQYASRIEANTGATLWTLKGWFTSPPLAAEDRVIFWNYIAYPANSSDYVQGMENSGHTLLCVDAATGNELWRYDVGVSVFQPTVSNGLVIFGATNGNIYALNLADGTMAWKTRVDPSGYMAGNNLPAQAKSDSAPAVTPIVVDNQTGRLLWGFAVTQTAINGVNGDDLYIGLVCSLNVANGDVAWIGEFQRNGTVSTTPPLTPTLGLAFLKGTAYLTANLDLWSINAATGQAAFLQGFDHYVLPPVLAGDKVIVAADLFLTAYQ